MRTLTTILFALPLAACTEGGSVVPPDEPRDTDPTADTADTGDSGGETGDTGASTAACPSFAPFDDDRAWWKYEVEGYPLTFTATGETTWKGLRAFGHRMSVEEYGMEMTLWYTCEADGLHQAGVDFDMSGQEQSFFYDPQPLLMPAHPEVGAEWSVDYTIYEGDGGGAALAAGAAAYASEGTPDTFTGAVTGRETLELEGGTFDTWVLSFHQEGNSDQMWWADGVGYVRQGVVPENMDLIDWGPR